MDLNDIARDSGKIENGDWVSDIPGMGDLKLRVRGMGSVAFGNAIRSANGGLSKEEREAKARDIETQALADAILLDWQNLQHNGKPVAYSKAKALKLLGHPRLPMFRAAVVMAADKVDTAKARLEEDMAKN